MTTTEEDAMTDRDARISEFNRLTVQGPPPARFRTTEDRIEAGEHIIVAVAEVRDGHTVTRTRRESTTYAGRRGRAAEVEWWADYRCTCGARTVQSTTVADAMARLGHFDSPADRDAYEAAEAERAARIIDQLR